MDPSTNPYAASCNPSRKAKVPRPNESSPQSSSTPTTNAPAACITEDASTSQAQPQPAKRGRKPGTMSKAARETQRKLNHSIIEKARRTKINDALATLRQLVPPDFGNEKKQADDGEEEADSDDDDDGDYQDKKKSKPKKPGKKEEKEREFKLEILIRTVAYMQHLIQRVNDLEEQVGVQSSSYPSETKKRKHTNLSNTTIPDQEANTRRKLDNLVDQPTEHHSRPRLPSISAWLPEIDSALKSHSQSSPTLPLPVSPPLTFPTTSPAHLPSPPSSTQFKPLSPPSKGLPQLPSLNLGPTAMLTRSRSNTLATTASATTPEEESAVSVLLNFRKGASCSPAFLPTPGSSVVFGSGNGTTLPRPSPSPNFTIEASMGEFEPMDLTLGPSQTKEWSPLTGFTSSLSSTSSSRTPPLDVGSRNFIAQTPSSILGLRRG